jgi:hypothetical protein
MISDFGHVSRSEGAKRRPEVLEKGDMCGGRYGTLFCRVESVLGCARIGVNGDTTESVD